MRKHRARQPCPAVTQGRSAAAKVLPMPSTSVARRASRAPRASLQHVRGDRHYSYETVHGSASRGLPRRQPMELHRLHLEPRESPAFPEEAPNASPRAVQGNICDPGAAALPPLIHVARETGAGREAAAAWRFLCYVRHPRGERPPGRKALQQAPASTSLVLGFQRATARRKKSLQVETARASHASAGGP